MKYKAKMEEEDFRTKRSLVVSYIFNSLMIVSIIFLIGASSIVFNPEEIINADVRFGVVLGFVSFIFIMASILTTTMDNLIYVIGELKERRYE